MPTVIRTQRWYTSRRCNTRCKPEFVWLERRSMFSASNVVCSWISLCGDTEQFGRTLNPLIPCWVFAVGVLEANAKSFTLNLYTVLFRTEVESCVRDFKSSALLFWCYFYNLSKFDECFLRESGRKFEALVIFVFIIKFVYSSREKCIIYGVVIRNHF